MSVLLNNALTGLMAAQAGLRTTSNNTANVNTDGYSRQRLNQVAVPGLSVGKLTMGNGVAIAGIERMFDGFLVDQFRETNSLEQRFVAFNELANRIDGILGDTDFGVTPAIQDFFNQLQTVAQDSTSMVNRQLLISQGQSLEQRIQQFGNDLDGIGTEVNRRLSDFVSSINTSSVALSQINAQIVAAGDSASADLLDQRERLLTDLTSLIDIRTQALPNGAIGVFIGNGRPLVLGTESFALQTAPDEFDPSKLQLVHVVGARSEVISNQVSGGAVGGLLALRRQALDPAEQNLGLIAFGLTESFNQQHAKGLDLNGNLGGNFFRQVQAVATSSANNSGTGSLTAVIADTTNVQPRDHILRFDGTNWQATDASTGTLLSMSGSGSGVDPFVVDGLEIVVTPGAVAGDKFLVRAVSEAAKGFAVTISDAAAIAAANPVSTGLAFSNIGSGSVSAAIVDDSTNPALLQAVNIVFDDTTTYRIFDGVGTDLTGPLAFTSGADIAFNGWRIQISGAPSAGDEFNIAATPIGSGDNGNATELTAIRARGFLNGGRTSVNDTISNMIASVGGAAQQSAQGLAAQSALRHQLELDVQNVSGVNLDEEAVNALRYQEAFMASSRIIAMADDLFLSILNAIGRR